jgi:hypothetical protein
LQSIDAANQSVAGTEACSVGTEEVSFRYELCLEPLRIAAVWTAFGLLSFGYARGGKEELHALEAVRIDAADGTLDGKLDEKAAETMMKAGHDDDESNDPELDEVDEQAIHAANERARQELGVQVISGDRW